MSSPPSLPPPIRKVPRAFARWASDYNQALDALRILTNLQPGTGVSVTWSKQNVVIRNTAPDRPIFAGAGISVADNGTSVTITNLNP